MKWHTRLLPPLLGRFFIRQSNLGRRQLEADLPQASMLHAFGVRNDGKRVASVFVVYGMGF